MEDIITYEIQEAMPNINQHNSDADSSDNDPTSLSDTTIQDADDDVSTDRSTTPVSLRSDSVGFPPFVEVPITSGIHDLYPDHPNDVDLGRVQHLQYVLHSVPLNPATDHVRRSMRRRRLIDYAQYHASGQRGAQGEAESGGDGEDGGTPRLC